MNELFLVAMKENPENSTKLGNPDPLCTIIDVKHLRLVAGQKNIFNQGKNCKRRSGDLK